MNEVEKIVRGYAYCIQAEFEDINCDGCVYASDREDRYGCEFLSSDFIDEEELVSLPLPLALKALTILNNRAPIEPTYKDGNYFCGLCKRHLISVDSRTDKGRLGMRYCPSCGQAVDWGAQ